ncbi:MAG: apolipoprotein N-acyltransferase [bacterium]|nr:apolipoprotein N-acyltransferase [bacterium]
MQFHLNHNHRLEIVLTVILSALLYGLSFPKFSVGVLGFVFLVPLLHLVKSGKVKKVFLVFFSFSFLSYLLIWYWTAVVMEEYGGAGKGLGLVGLAALSGFFAVLGGFAGSLIKRLPLVMVPVIWIAKALVIEKIISGFPWCLTGYSQHGNTYFIQLAEFGGIHLISFLLIGFNVLLYRLLTRRDKYTAAALLVSILAVYSTGYFLYRAEEAKIADLPRHKAGIIQPNTNNNPISRGAKERILTRLLQESEELARQGAEFVVWPEHTVYIYPMRNKEDFNRLQGFARSHVPLLAGFTDLQSSSEIYNSAILFEKDRTQKYDKVHLAPFGEYVLFREFLFFVKKITDQIGDFTPGPGARNLFINGHAAATPICYEIIFPELVREFISNGAEVIITISNDSWFGTNSAPFQHLAMAIFRSIENRRYILRSTTNGVSAVISPSGEFHYRSPHGEPDRFIARFSYIQRETIFTGWGYLFPYLCFILLVVYFVINRRGHRAGGARDLKKGNPGNNPPTTE